MNFRQVDPDTLHMTPRCLLVGHTAPILCISMASIIQDNNYIVSSSEAGEMCTWDLVDGKCREAVKLSQVHTNMQVNKLLGKFPKSFFNHLRIRSKTVHDRWQKSHGTDSIHLIIIFSFS